MNPDKSINKSLNTFVENPIVEQIPLSNARIYKNSDNSEDKIVADLHTTEYEELTLNVINPT